MQTSKPVRRRAASCRERRRVDKQAGRPGQVGQTGSETPPLPSPPLTGQAGPQMGKRAGNIWKASRQASKQADRERDFAILFPIVLQVRENWCGCTHWCGEMVVA